MSKSNNKGQYLERLLHLLPSKFERLFLWGPMGSGKSTVLPYLAKALEIPHIDLDCFIEEQAGKSIGRLFKEEGREAFRQMEADALHLLVSRYPRLILATGGGTPCFFDNADFMLQNGFCIYLRVAPSILAERLSGQTRHRPLLQGLKGAKALLDFFERHLEEREAFYLRADLIFSLNE